MGDLIWLASYPKSGNTWMRIFLTNYWRDADNPVDINDLDVPWLVGRRSLFDQYTGLKSSDLTMDEIDALRPEIYRHLAQQLDKTLVTKVHDAYQYLSARHPLFPPEITKGALYLIRNPLDVAVSYAVHCGASLDESIAWMKTDTSLASSSHALSLQLRQRMLSWSDHVHSWVEGTEGFPVHVVRYEDMYAHPLATFAEVVTFIGTALDPARLEKAIRFSSFQVVRQQEQTKGYVERPPTMDFFFRKGQVGSWCTQLSQAQVKQIIADHHEVMQRFGYLTDTGEPVF